MDDHHHYHHQTNILSNPNDHHHHISPMLSMLEQDFVNIPLIHYHQSYHDHHHHHHHPPPPPSHHNLMQINGVFKDEPVTLPDPGLIVDMIKADTNDDRLESEEVDHASPNHGGGKARNLNVKLKAKSSAGTAAKQKKAIAHKRIICVPASTAHDHSKYATVECLHSDSWAWRKYGQKPIKGSPFPRAYYRCSSSKGCTARKQVERSKQDPSMLVITYSSEHNHALPTPKGSHSKYVKKLDDSSRPITTATIDSATTPTAYTPHIKSPDHSTSTLNNDDSPRHQAPSSSSSPPHIPSSPSHIPSSPTVTNTEDAAVSIDPSPSELRQDPPDPDEDYNSILGDFFIATKPSSDQLDVDNRIDQFPSIGDPFNLLHWTSGYDYFFES